MIAPFVALDPGAPCCVDRVPSPIGDLLLTGSDDGLTGLYMLGAPGGRPPATPPGTRPQPGAFVTVKAQLRAYFAGERRDFDVPLSPVGSPFQLAVWSALTRIPYGTTTSYGAIARQLGKSPAASRAVGAANGKNPIAVIIPCHRVIGADGGLTGYGGGLDRKELLLRLEGAPAMAAQDATLWLPGPHLPPLNCGFVALMDADSWYASLPTMYGSAAALITDTDGPSARVLLVKPNYREWWSLPGGILEEGEPPHVGCFREVEEELGLLLPAGPLLAVSWTAPEGDRPKPIISFIFDGGVLADPGGIRLQEEELDDWRFTDPADFGEYLPPFLVPRVEAALTARFTGVPAYVAIEEPVA